MILISLITIITLIIAGLFHFYWAFDGKIGLNRAIPTINGKALLNPSKFLTMLVGLIILSFGWVAYALSFKDLSIVSYSEQIVYMGWLLSGIFFIRTVGDFNTVGLFKKIKLTKFSEFDTKYFVPLTFFWSISFVLITYQAQQNF